LLAQAEECFLNYSEARKHLERAMEVSGNRARSDLKKLAMYAQYAKEWGQLRLSAVQLRALGDYLRSNQKTIGTSRSLALTESWLYKQGFQNVPEILEGIKAYGAYDDWQVLENLVRG
jgi:hypothetical protein